MCGLRCYWLLLGRQCAGDGGGEYRLCKFRWWGDLVMDRVHTWLCWPWSSGAGTQVVCTVKVTVRQSRTVTFMMHGHKRLKKPMECFT